MGQSRTYPHSNRERKFASAGAGSVGPFFSVVADPDCERVNMDSNSSMNSVVQMLRDDLRDQRAAIRQSHNRGLTGPRVSAKLASVIDVIVYRLLDVTLAQLDSQQADLLRADIAIVGLGSFARRQCSPHSDVDLMILHQHQASEDIAAQLRPLTQGIFDVGLQLGHSIRTPAETVQLARSDTVICTSLIDARLVIGNRVLFESFRSSFEAMVRKNSKSLCREFLDSRAAERDQYGETLYLLEPHVKRSRGGLRDLNLLRWLSFAEFGISDPDRLHQQGVLSKFDYHRLQTAREFLLRLRNEMHFHADSAHDLLNRAEQLRISDWHSYAQRGGLLPVEDFMRDYFRHTNHIWQLVRRRDASLQVVSAVKRVLDPMMSKKIDGNYRIGLTSISATPAGLEKVKQDLSAVLRIVELSAREEKLLDHATWSALLLAVTDYPGEVTDEVNSQFYRLLASTQSVGKVLRVLHELGYLEKIIPAMKHARCLLQFNQYHKYTVDEHCLRAVSKAAEFADREDALGKAYRDIADKRTLHLALLLHDLGKGFEEDHSEVGKRIATETTELLNLDAKTSDDVVFLVHKHLVMSHLTFRRDTSDEQLIESFAEDVGSAERLRMLFVLTCADLAAVGPGVLNGWKTDLLADVYVRTLRYFDQGDDEDVPTQLAEYRRAVLEGLSPAQRLAPWFNRHVEALPASFLANCEVADAVEALQRFHRLPENTADAWCAHQPETNTLQFTAGVNRGGGRGAFSSMAGALSSAGLAIHSAETDLLPDGLLMLRYVATDPKSPTGNAKRRWKQLCQAMVASVDSDEPPKFPTVWGAEQAEASIQLSALSDAVRIDTGVSDAQTVIEVFTFDRSGLLYKLARRLHELDLTIFHAKIGTHLDQVVDVFYVTDREQRKVIDPDRLEMIRDELLAVIERKS